MRPTIEAYVRALSGDIEQAYTLEALAGGYWNQVYRYQTPEQDWVIKVFNTAGNSPLYPVLPQSEAEALRLLSGTGCAPQFVAFEPDSRLGAPVLIYDFVEGSPWSGERRADFVSAGALFAQLHSLPVSSPCFRTLAVTGLAIQTEADKMLDAIRQEASTELKKLLALRSQIQATTHPHVEQQVFVHTDTGPGNLITGPRGLCLIDWQCPGMGDPCQDLCVFLSPAMQLLYDRPPLTLKQREWVLEGYADPITLDRLPRVQGCYHYRIAAYCLYRQQELESSDPETSAKYARASLAELDFLEALVA